VTKGDKKKKKEVDAQIEFLEKNFSDKCALEVDRLSSVGKMEAMLAEQSNLETVVAISGQKLSKTQKKRDKKEQEEKLRNEQLAIQEIENLKGPAHVELTKIKEKLNAQNLEINEVASDGNCMFYAVSDQLVSQLGIDKSFKELRELTSKFMLEKADEFQPYMCSEDTGDPLSSEEYEDYCLKIKDCIAPVWGSMTELRALAEIFKVVIEVVQAEGSEILIGNNEDGCKHLIVTYHRRMFGSGEHYNSTRLLKKNIDF